MTVGTIDSYYNPMGYGMTDYEYGMHGHPLAAGGFGAAPGVFGYGFGMNPYGQKYGVGQKGPTGSYHMDKGGADDGKIGAWKSLTSVTKGATLNIIKGIAENPLQVLGSVAAVSAGLFALSFVPGGWAVPLAIGAMSAFGAAKGATGIITSGIDWTDATSDKAAVSAAENLGTNVSVTLLSLLGLRGAAKGIQNSLGKGAAENAAKGAIEQTAAAGKEALKTVDDALPKAVVSAGNNGSATITEAAIESQVKHLVSKGVLNAADEAAVLKKVLEAGNTAKNAGSNQTVIVDAMKKTINEAVAKAPAINPTAAVETFLSKLPESVVKGISKDKLVAKITQKITDGAQLTDDMLAQSLDDAVYRTLGQDAILTNAAKNSTGMLASIKNALKDNGAGVLITGPARLASILSDKIFQGLSPFRNTGTLLGGTNTAFASTKAALGVADDAALAEVGTAMKNSIVNNVKARYNLAQSNNAVNALKTATTDEAKTAAVTKLTELASKEGVDGALASRMSGLNVSSTADDIAKVLKANKSDVAALAPKAGSTSYEGIYSLGSALASDVAAAPAVAQNDNQIAWLKAQRASMQNFGNGFGMMNSNYAAGW